jgi:hypothetical protein
MLPWIHGRVNVQPVSRRIHNRDGLGWTPGYAGFVTEEVELGQVFSEYFGFPCQFPVQRMLHTQLSFGASISVADIPSKLTPPHKIEKHERNSESQKK